MSSRFSKSAISALTPAPKKIKPVLPQMTICEKRDILEYIEFNKKETINDILSDGPLICLTELQGIYNARDENTYYISFKPNNPNSIQEIAEHMKLLNDINLLMSFDRRELSEEKRFIWTELRIINITKHTKKMVLAIYCNPEEQVSHQTAWGYTKKGNNNNTNNNKGADPFA